MSATSTATIIPMLRQNALIPDPLLLKEIKLIDIINKSHLLDRTYLLFTREYLQRRPC